MEKLYQEHKKIIYAVTRGLAKKTGIDVDELESEANMIFTKCADRHPDAEKFDRYLKKSLNWGLYRYVRKRRDEINGLIFPSYEFEGPEQIKTTKHKEVSESFLSYDRVCEITFEDVSRDAKKIMDLVFNKEHISKDMNLAKPRLYKKHIFSYLKDRGWKTKRIMSGFNELTELVDSYQ